MDTQSQVADARTDGQPGTLEPGATGWSRRRWRTVIAGIVVTLAVYSWADPYGPIGFERIRGTAPLEEGFAGGLWVTDGTYVDLTTPFGSGVTVEVDGEAAITRLVTLRNVSNRTVTLTDVDGYAAEVEYDDREGTCHLVPRAVDLFVDRDGRHDDGSSASRASAAPLSGTDRVPAGRTAWIWVDSSYRTGPGCADVVEARWNGVIVDFELAGQEGYLHVEHRQVGFVPDLDAWIDEAVQVERLDGEPVSH
jgi:hypothetical protein